MLLDFYSRVFYEIKTIDYPRAAGMGQLRGYYAIAEEIRRAYADFDEPPWDAYAATWYPPHVLPLPGDFIMALGTGRPRQPPKLFPLTRSIPPFD
jgi:hypothetical protein